MARKYQINVEYSFNDPDYWYVIRKTVDGKYAVFQNGYEDKRFSTYEKAEAHLSKIEQLFEVED